LDTAGQRVRLVLYTLLIGLLVITAIPAADAQSGPQPARRFGVIGAIDAPEAAAELGVGWEQVTFDWADFQPHGPGDFVTDSVDPAGLAAAAGAGREMVGLILHTPPWASESGDLAAVPDGLDLSVGDRGNTWAAFVTQLVAFYAPQGIHRWIISEEPDIQRGEGHVHFAGGVEDYARLLRVAYLAATAADPRAQIHVAGMNWWVDVAAGREPYLARLLTVLRSDMDAPAYGYYFDVVMVRVFDNTQAVWDITTQTRAILAAAGMFDKPVWLVTNANPTHDPQAGVLTPLFGITPDQQADFVVQAAAIGLALGVERVAIDRLVDVPARSQTQDLIGMVMNWLATAHGKPSAWGLVRTDGSRRPAFDVYRSTIALFAPTVSAVWYRHAAADLIILEQGDRDVYVMWARGATPASLVITSGAVGEAAMFYGAYPDAWQTKSAPIEWPAAFTVELPAAWLDAHGFLTVAGSPRILVLDRSDFYRVVYLDTAYERFRLR
jgi:hypothetical protein